MPQKLDSVEEGIKSKLSRGTYIETGPYTKGSKKHYAATFQIPGDIELGSVPISIVLSDDKQANNTFNIRKKQGVIATIYRGDRKYTGS